EMIWLPYAALLAVTVGLGGYSLSLRARVADLEVRLADATSRTLLATRAMWSRRRGMVFTASNLPQLPAGRVYQVWVVTADARISAGLIMPDNSGSTTAMFATP